MLKNLTAIFTAGIVSVNSIDLPLSDELMVTSFLSNKTRIKIKTNSLKCLIAAPHQNVAVTALKVRTQNSQNAVVLAQ